MAAAAPPRPVFPRFALIGAGCAIALSMGAAVYSRINASATDGASLGRPIAAVDLRFTDEPDGSVTVVDSGSARVIATVPPQTNGFMRTTVRGLAQDRMHQGMSDAVPFRLTRWANGRVTLDDPATGRRIDLEAFGPTNEGAFVRLLPQPGNPG